MASSLLSWIRRLARATRPIRNSRQPGVRPMLEWLETRFLPTVYTVNTVNDILGDTTGSELTLRDAITAINTQAPSGNAPAGTASNTIKFAIGASGSAQTIEIGSGNTATPLPALTQQVTIDGQSQSGSGPVSAVPLISLDGTSAGAGADGLTFHPGSNLSEVSGLDIEDFSNTGIAINGASDILVTANHLDSNTSNGLLITGAAANNSIGSGLTGGGNVISANGINGIDITGVAAADNVIWGNLIGTNAAGTSPAGNGSDGILILGKASGNSIGGTTAGQRNVISGNGNGVEIAVSGTTGNVVLGNYIGTDVTGTITLGNTSDGVLIDSSASGNSIGGTATGAGNVISGNTSAGIEISGAGSNQVLGNLIGTDKTGTADLGNGNDGVLLDSSASGNTVGGTTAAATNVISTNVIGVEFEDAGTTGNLVEGNLLGTDITGSEPLGNFNEGVVIGSDVTGNTIGGTATGARNVIDDSGLYGIEITGSSNVVQGNLIGTDITGTAGLGTFGDGILLYSGASSNSIGGTTAGAGNVISANYFGVVLSGSGTSDNLVQGNLIGTTKNGNVALGNTNDGVLIELAATANTVGGTTAGAGNVISSNNNGVDITGTGTTNNFVQGNKIGTDKTGTINLGNTTDGVRVESGATNDTIGGTVAAASNDIAFNGKGVVLAAAVPNPTGISILGNSIYSNTGLGIDLNDDGPTANGANPRTFPNNGQNYPVLTGATSTSISGTLTSVPSTTFRLEFFATPSGGTALQGKTFLGFLNVTTSAAGTKTFTAPVSTIPPGSIITATATNLSNGDTSEFGALVPQVAVTNASATVSGASQLVTLSAKILLGGLPVKSGMVTFTIAGVPGTMTALVNTSGVATVQFTLPAGLAAGQYVITANYDGTPLVPAAKGTGTLTISAPPTQHAVRVGRRYVV